MGLSLALMWKFQCHGDLRVMEVAGSKSPSP